MKEFQKSTVMITGASRGIGKRIALGFAQSTDHALFLVARDKLLLEKSKQECIKAGCGLIDSAICDLTDQKQIDKLKLPGKLPDIGILINNAGTFLLKPLSETTPEEFRDQWNINAFAPFLLTRKLLPGLKKQERGMIVIISSMSALKGQSRSGAYASSKHALLGYSRSLRLELRDTNIAVTAINLGQTMSTSWEGIEVDPSELIDPDDVVSLIITLSRMSPRTVAEEIILKPQKGERSPD
jgi:short-subunit dehydrogenase